MRCSLKFLGLVICAALGVTGTAAPKDEKPKNGGKEAAKKKAAEKEAKAGQLADDGKMLLPIPKDHDSKGLKIPYFGDDGKTLQMTFAIGVARRLDDNRVKMTDLEVETFDEAGQREMLVALPSSTLDLTTRVISTKEGVTIKRSDFEITGDTMEFNTKTKHGQLAGRVRMLIFNLDAEGGAK